MDYYQNALYTAPRERGEPAALPATHCWQNAQRKAPQELQYTVLRFRVSISGDASESSQTTSRGGLQQ